MPARDGYLRVVFLASLEELRAAYQLMSTFSASYLARS
jgi:hypothetical protein